MKLLCFLFCFLFCINLNYTQAIPAAINASVSNTNWKLNSINTVFQNKTDSCDNFWFLSFVGSRIIKALPKSKKPIIIAVIDDGFDLKHIEFKNRVYKPYNVINDTKKVSFDSNHKHGTHVAGIVGAAGNNGIGITGIAPQCRIMPIQASGPHVGFYMTDVVDGILYAIKNNADVINLSLGKMFTDDILNLSIDGQQNLINQNGKDEADFWNELFQMAEDNKVTIVIAAGNQDVIVGMDPMQRSDKVIKIAACNNSKQKADFSNYFKTLSNNGSCLSAPGVSIFSTLPENQYDYMDGTSMASPMVAGVVGLMKSANKNLTNKQIMRILFDTGFNTSNQKIGPLIQADKAVKKAKLMQ